MGEQFFLGGDNTVMWGPMAWTIIYGILFATFLTLIVVPVMYWLAYNGKTSLISWAKRKPRSNIAPDNHELYTN